MAITGARAFLLTAQNQTGDAVPPATYTHNFGSAYAWGQAMLQTINHTDAQGSFAADAYVSQYSKAGEPTPHYGYWHVVSGPDLISITYVLTVNGCLASAVAVTQFFG
jgi:hypothetical protein